MVFSHVQQQVDRQYQGPCNSEQLESEEVYQEAHIIVHPGFSQLNVDTTGENHLFEWLDQRSYDPNYSSIQEYEGFKSGLRDILHETTEPILVLYDEGQLDQYQDFLEDDIRYEASNVDIFIETEPDSGYIREDEIPVMAEILDSLDSKATIRFHGEQNGKCIDDSIDSLRHVEDLLEQELVKEKGKTFPPCPL